MKIRLTLEYDGTNYVGWQSQPNGPSIQAALEGALSSVAAEPIAAVAAGRTDAGVHALGQVVSFETATARPLKAWILGANDLLPRDIAVVAAQDAPADFDARRSAQGKRYRYRIWNGRTRSPLRARTSWEIFRALDVAAMARAAEALVGEHDFAAFRGAGCDAKTTVRKLRELRVAGEPRGEIFVEAEATAFLRHMVRNIVGTLVEVGLGKRAPEDVARVLASRDRKLAGPTAPPQGLCLVEVRYEDAV